MKFLENFLLKTNFDFVSLGNNSLTITLDDLNVNIDIIYNEVQVLCEGKICGFNRTWKFGSASEEEIIDEIILFINECKKRLR